VEQGTHAELLALDGQFSKLARQQSLVLGQSASVE
jgi:ABC-type multidrug transport system fused ATPase/permease subunit